jgi:hypothetical protein
MGPEMIDLLLEIKAKVDELKQEPRPLSSAEKDAFKKRYDQIVAVQVTWPTHHLNRQRKEAGPSRVRPETC